MENISEIIGIKIGDKILFQASRSIDLYRVGTKIRVKIRYYFENKLAIFGRSNTEDINRFIYRAIIDSKNGKHQ